MGNEIKKYKKRFTKESFDFFIDVLHNTAEQFLAKKKIDDLVAGAKVLRHRDIDVYRDQSAGNILGRIRPRGGHGPLLEGSSTRRGSQSTEHEQEVSFPKQMLKSTPAEWNYAQVTKAKDLIASFRRIKKSDESQDSNKAKPLNIPDDRKVESWTPFGRFPPPKKKTMEFIDKQLIAIPFNKLPTGSGGVVFSRRKGCIVGAIIPDGQETIHN